jgi:3'(2'), 5'-bisphosphate nucleotidase
MINTQSPEIEFALQAVRQASRLVKQVQTELVAASITKEDRSPVTVADFAAQALIGRMLEQVFPEDPLVGEEDSSVLRTPEQAQVLSKITTYAGLYTDGATPDEVCRWIDRGSAESGERFWTLDPIDGTKGFVRGDQYAVALALVENGQVRLGVLGCPNLNLAYLQGDADADLAGDDGALVLAVRGEGAWIAGLEDEAFARISVSERTDPSRARLLRSYETAHTNTGKIGEMVEYMGVKAQPVGLDSQAKYALLAAGRGDMLVRLLSSRQPDYREKIWDQAAGVIVVEESGGRITDLHGRTLDFTQGRTLAGNRGVLASNGQLHAAGLEALAEIGA